MAPQSAYDREMMPNPRWATDELCGGDLPCIQAVTSDTPGGLTDDERESFEFGISCSNTWVGEDGQDC